MWNSATLSPTTKGLETTLHKGLHQEKCYTTQSGAGSGGYSCGGGGGGGSGGGGGGSHGGGGVSGSGGGGGGGGGAGRGAAAQRGGFGGSQCQHQPRFRETPSAQQLREWYAGRGMFGGAGPCTYVFAPAVVMGRRNVPIFDLDFDAMYALTDSAKGDCNLCVPPDPGIAAAALGASASAAPNTGESAALGTGESALLGTAPTEALHTFTLDSGASRSFFRDSTTLTTLSWSVGVSLADPSGGPVLAHSSTVLPCFAAPSGLLSGLHPPSFSTNLVSGADLQDAWVDQFAPGGQRVTHCTCSRTGLHLTTFTRRPRSSLYTLTTASPLVSTFGQVAVSGQVFAAASRSSPASAPCSCRPLSHETLLWHHRLGHPFLPHLRGMASRTLVSGLPRSLPPLPLGPAPTCVSWVEGRQRAAPHSSTFHPKEAPLQTLHMDVAASSQVLAAASGSGPESAPCSCRLLSHQTLLWHHRLGHPSLPRLRGMASRVLVSGLPRSLPPLPSGPAPTCVPCVEGRQRAAPHSSVFPPTEAPLQTLHMDVWGPARVRGQGHERYFLLVVDDYSRYTTVFPLRSKAFCRAQSIHQTFTFPASPQQNGIAERRIGMYAAHQLNLQPRVSLPETSPTLLWTGKVGDASAFRVWGSRAFVRDLYADKLSPRAVPCDVTFDESVPYYRLFPYRTASLPPPPLFLAPGPPPVDPLPPQGPAPSGVSQVDAVEPVEVAVESGAATGAEPAGAGSGGAGSGGAETEGAEPGGAGTGGAEPGGAESGGTEPGGAEPWGTEPGGAEPGGAGSARVASRGASLRREVLSPQKLREWFARRWGRAAGAGGTTAAAETGGTCPGGAGAAGPGGTAEAAGVGPTGGSAGASGGPGAAGSAGPGAAGAAGVGAAGGVGAGVSAAAGTSEGAGAGAAGAGGATGAGAPAGSPGAVPAGSGDAPRPRPYFVPLLEQPVSPLPAPSPYTGPTGGLAERRAPASCPASPARPACTSRRTSRPRPPAVPGTHQMALRPSTAPLRVPLPSPPASSLPVLADPESDSLRAASPTVARFLATVVTDPSLVSTAASALVAELVDFAARCHLDYAASLFAEQEEFQCFAAALPHLVSTLLAPEGDPDAPDIPTPRSYVEAIEGPYSSQWQAAMDGEMASWKCTGTYVDEVPPPGANIVSGMWIFRVKRPPGSPPVFKARYVARGFSQRQGVDYFQRTRESPFVAPVFYSVSSSFCDLEEDRQETKHIALRYFLARELQQRGQLRLAYVASEANTADIFTKALAPGDHQRFCTMLGLLALLCLTDLENGIAERRIGMVMDVAHTSMIHAAAPHFLWPFAIQYVAHQINLQPRVSSTTPTLSWTGKVGDASAFRVWGSRAFVRDTSANKLSSRAVLCVFLGSPPDVPGWQLYYPTSRRVLSSQDVTFDESVSYYRLFPYRTASLPPLPLFLAPGTPPVDPLPPQGPAPSGVSQVDPAEPVEVAVD
ncbi:unnamed protein product [Closterium sp. NIES-53]